MVLMVIRLGPKIRKKHTSVPESDFAIAWRFYKDETLHAPMAKATGNDAPKTFSGRSSPPRAQIDHLICNSE
jgi:hypothetical protein